jgi:hypothetical protein
MSRTFQQQLVINGFEAILEEIRRLPAGFDWRAPIVSARHALLELEKACGAIDSAFADPPSRPATAQRHPPLFAHREPAAADSTPAPAAKRSRKRPAIVADVT